jgi:hypothetical protein
VPERRGGARARPWLQLDRVVDGRVAEGLDARCPGMRGPLERFDDVESVAVEGALPPERPFAGDALDTLDAMRQNTVAREQRRRRVRRVGTVTVIGLVISVGYDLALRVVGAR